jgi:hypothetical protein
MPPVRNLTTSATPTLTIPVVETPQPSTAVAIPAWAQTSPAIPEQSLKGPSAPFIGQLQENTGKRQQLQAAGVQVGDFYIDDGGAVTPLRPLRFWLLQATPFRSRMDAAGNVIQASRDFHDKAAGDEHIVTLIVVDAGGRLVPCKADFRKAAWQVANDALNGVKRATSPEFPKESDAARVAAQFPAPFGRVTITASVGSKVSRTSGKKYYPASAVATPTTVTDLKRLSEALQDPEFAKRHDDALRAYQYRVEQIGKACK